MPVIAAGLRVAAVSNVSLVSVSALIGVPELGQLFTNGFQLAYQTPILLGILLSVLLALAFDTAIQLLDPAAHPVAAGGEAGMIARHLELAVRLGALVRRRTASRPAARAPAVLAGGAADRRG